MIVASSRNAPIQFRISPSLARLRAAMRGAAHEMADLRIPHRQIAVFLDRWVQQNFRTEGGEVGGWQPFAIGGRWVGRGSTRRFDPAAKLLQDTGRLRASYESFYSARDAGIGSNLDYAEPQNDGTRTLPARRMIPRKEEVADDVRGIYRRHVDRALGRLQKR